MPNLSRPTIRRDRAGYGKSRIRKKGGKIVKKRK